MKGLRILAAALASILFICQTANAANVWLWNQKVARIYPAGNGGSFVLMFNSTSPSCTNPNNYYYVTVGQNGITEDGLKNLLAVAMFAMATDRNVSIIFDSASGYCQVNTLLVDG